MQKDSKQQEVSPFFLLFKLEDDFAALSPEERYGKRLEQEKPVLDVLLTKENALMPKTSPKSVLVKALYYLLER